MSKIQKSQGNLVNAPSEKHVVSIMLQIPNLHWNYWLHTFLCIFVQKPFRQLLRSIYKQQMLPNKLQKKCTEYLCDKCHYACSNLTNFNKHLLTNKHIARCCSDNAPISCLHYNCECGHTYKHRQRGQCPREHNTWWNGFVMLPWWSSWRPLLALTNLFNSVSRRC